MRNKNLVPTVIPVSIPTNHLHANKIEEAGEQLEQLAFQLQSLFYFVQKTCQLFDHLDMSEEQVRYNFNVLRGQLDGTCAIGLGLSDAVQICGERLVFAKEEKASDARQSTKLEEVS